MTVKTYLNFRAFSRRLLLTVSVCAFCSHMGAALAQPPLPPETAARSYILFDMSSQQVLAAKDPDMPLEPASLTKIMSAYLIFQALRDGRLQLNQDLPVSERAWRTGMKGASRTFIQVGTTVKVDDLLKGMIIQSGNDATIALAEAVGGSVEHFVELMNRQATVFNLKNTTFKNPEGLPATGHVSTAHDLAVISANLIRDFPETLIYDSTKEFTYGGIKQTNRNLLLWRDPTVDGLKTGFTDAAGYCLIATSKRETPSGSRRLLSVVLGTASSEARASESQKLLNWGYAAFDAVKVFEAGHSMTSARVWKGQSKTAKLGQLAPLVVSVPRGMGKELKTEVQRNDPLLAPLTRGQRVGTIRISLSGKPFTERPLLALEDVPSAGWLGRAWDSVRLGVQ